MGFTIYQAGSGSKVCQEEIKKLGCNQLLSQLNERKAVMDWVQYKREHPESKSKLFIDSGAFSAHTKGKHVDVDEYINLMNEIDDAVYIFAQVDTIPGEFGKPKTPEQLAEAPKLSWDNYLYMVERVKSRDKLLPIFHQGEDFKWLHNMLEYRHADGKPIWYIGISPANDVSTALKAQWLIEVFRIIKSSSNPNVCTHAFGMTSLNLLEQFPFTSADSTSWIMTAANGGVMTAGGNITTSDRQLDSPDHIYNKSKAKLDDTKQYVKKFGFELEDLVSDPDNRTLFNLRYLKDWADNYQYRGNNYYKKKLIDF